MQLDNGLLPFSHVPVFFVGHRYVARRSAVATVRMRSKTTPRAPPLSPGFGDRVGTIFTEALIRPLIYGAK